MTPAEELRKAAKTLRETAELATRGPWVFHPTVSRSDIDNYDDAWTICRPWCMRENNAEECEPDCGENVLQTGAHGCEEDFLKAHDASWIALVHPGLAEPLASLLGWYADAYEAKTINRPATVEALAVARVINGGAR